MSFLKKLLYWLITGLLVFIALWMVVINNEAVTLSLIFTDIGPVNVGLVIFVTFMLGLTLGLLIGVSWTRMAHWKHKRQKKAAERLSTDFNAKPDPNATVIK